ncbi:MAG TPA: hypothetical protein VJ816_07790, partial [Gemmatimonadales bacterium]|nr:hypothetical protein [Gemmatimonadales bacterium]
MVQSIGFALLAIVAQGDSQAVLRRAQRAQAEFEWSRWAQLPTGRGRSSGCADLNAIHIGRFCYTDDGLPPDLPPEPAAIGVSRRRLLQVLDSAAAALPGDEWIIGQRVRYLVEGGRPAEALTAARACRSDAWWCEALAGFSLHAAGDTPAADSAYSAALRDMPREERCRWNDLSFLVEGRLRKRYRQQTCEQREALEARLWWLAQPLFSRPGNDRRVEHYARHTMARMLEHSRSLFDMGFGRDLRELIVRYGWPTAWTREPRGVGTTERVVVGHSPEPTHFLPDEADIDSVGKIDTLRPQEVYAPAYAAAFTALDPEIAAFRRGDSTLVVAAYDVREDTLFQSSQLTAALVLARGESDPFVVERRAQAGLRATVIAMAPWPARLASLEVLTEPRAAGRARVALPERNPDARIALSDLLVFDPPDSLPGDLGDVLPHLRGSASVPRGSRLGLYWEAYGLAPAEAVAISVSVQALDKGLL